MMTHINSTSHFSRLQLATNNKPENHFFCHLWKILQTAFQVHPWVGYIPTTTYFRLFCNFGITLITRVRRICGHPVFMRRCFLSVPRCKMLINALTSQDQIKYCIVQRYNVKYCPKEKSRGKYKIRTWQPGNNYV